MKHVLVRHWSITAVLAASMCLVSTGVGRAERDHLLGYRIRDLNGVGASPLYLQNQFGSQNCETGRSWYLFAESEKNYGDDPRGGHAGDFICYYARCRNAPLPVVDGDSQFGGHSIQGRRPRLVCAPLDTDVCGDSELDPGETCDGTAGPCPGFCTSDCNTCATACPASGGNAQACMDVMFANDPLCATCCAMVPACNTACDAAVAAGCASPTDNDACAAAINATGGNCVQQCCN